MAGSRSASRIVGQSEGARQAGVVGGGEYGGRNGGGWMKGMGRNRKKWKAT